MENYVGEIRMFGGVFAPQGWAFCNGQMLSIADNETLYTLIGTFYGGDGQTTFQLPNLQGRLPVGQGTGPGLTPKVIGQLAGTESVTLTSIQMPAHSHPFSASTDNATLEAPTNAAVIAKPDTTDVSAESIYAIPGTTVINPAILAPQSIGLAGGSQPHENRMPALAVSFIIALQGIFPSRN